MAKGRVLVTANMAVIPERVDSARVALRSIRNQVDVVRVWWQGPYDEAPTDWRDSTKPIDVLQANGRNFGDQKKFFWNYGDEAYFSCDDDIIYPPNYVEKMLAHQLETGAQVVSAHCWWVKDEWCLRQLGYFRSRKVSHFADQYPIFEGDDPPPHGCGTGVALIYQQPFNSMNCPTPNMTDIYLALMVKRLGLKISCVPRGKNWLTQAPQKGASLFDRYINDDGLHTLLLAAGGVFTK